MSRIEQCEAELGTTSNFAKFIMGLNPSWDELNPADPTAYSADQLPPFSEKLRNDVVVYSHRSVHSPGGN
jgi:hypothetical protein